MHNIYFCIILKHSIINFRMKSLDLVCMKQLDTKVNIIPVIAKADTISKTELSKFKVDITTLLLVLLHFQTH